MKECIIFQPDGEVLTYQEGKDDVMTILDRSDDYPVVRIFTKTKVIIYKGIPFVIREDKHDERGPR